MPPYRWGIDSAAAADMNLFECVVDNFGYPDYWGRYLTTVPGVSEGLSEEEIRFLRGSGVRIMPIYNVFRQSVIYARGKEDARRAIRNARRLGIRQGTVIFANVEHFFNVDAGWIQGWVDEMYPSGYKPGFYHDPVRGQFSDAYCQAIEESDRVRTQSILWSAEPEPGVTTRANKPEFNPATPPCEANVWAWQYGRDADECPIDTNLIDQRLFDDLW
ncbi:glycoside hydrolase domain-containing protein [Desertibacillus haloalkaliphilus]|uniref:glycoside hydrolase domain-containing protein n=1 Tax=Desertibacillus haloalkaliphilus TaxID=1328930 RepID=UPI001C266FB3|nr:glycoside hydrolase domain-containing protein [Desertibacillus haloalkaliphilus]MBU8904979.1 DUF1906 domain-containing protein [Desertibacillus haloalkaliphilus]